MVSWLRDLRLGYYKNHSLATFRPRLQPYPFFVFPMQFLVGLLVLLLNPGCRYSFGFIYSLVSGQREGSGDWLHSIFLPRYSLSRICVISLDFPGLDLVTRSCGYAWLGATLGASPEPRVCSALFDSCASCLLSSTISISLFSSSSHHGTF